MRSILSLVVVLLSVHVCTARQVHGTITDSGGSPLSFASVTVKGTSKGAVANSQGKYVLQLEPGSYTLICQYVGFHSEEKKITVGSSDLIIDFRLSIQELKMEEVVIRRGEDPALEIMRQAIRKRSYYNNQVDAFTVDVYIKGLMRSRSVPTKFMGQTIEKDDQAKEGIDSAGKGILFLSESLTKVSFARPDKFKYDVLSSRQSGGGYGLSLPFFINFYNNNVSVSNANPRGFISPIAENAFHYYKFHYEGNFFEGRKMIDRIKVTPRRKNEPLFEGYIQIIDGEWRIHSLDLLTTTDNGLELIDTLHITQIHSPVNDSVWKTQNQVVYVTLKKFGFEVAGDFLNVYSNYDIDRGFGKKYFDRIFMRYDSAANKKDSGYWASIRPVPLEPDERRDYVFKDSVRQTERDSFSRMNIDSLNKKQKPVKFTDVFFTGVSHNHFSRRAFTTYTLGGLVRHLEYNTVEGLAVNILPGVSIRPRKGKLNYNIDLAARYGFSNEHFNSFATVSIMPRSERYRNRLFRISGGKTVSQFNHDEPIGALMNSLYTLLYKKNYIKLYENWFGALDYANRFENGIKLSASLRYEDRIPLENTTDYSFFKQERTILPNHPYELAGVPFEKHQAFVASITVSFQPRQQYIQYPDYKEPLGSKYPTFEATYSKGIKDIFSSDVDFDKWGLTVNDDVNMKMGGLFRYRVGAGGFINTNRVEIPDFKHFNGNQTLFSEHYLNSFQLAPYYRYSNIESLYGELHIEHHFNGLLTNKIPLFNRLKWHLVAGTNTFYVDRNNYYVEAFAGIENIFKVFRVDFISVYQAAPGHNFGIRLGMGGLIGGLAQASR